MSTQTQSVWKPVAQLFHRQQQKDGTTKYKVVNIYDVDGKGMLQISEEKTRITTSLSSAEWFYLAAVAQKRGSVQLETEAREIERKNAEYRAKQAAITPAPSTAPSSVETVSGDIEF